ncbi:anti-sigma factor, partial [Thioclava sp. BHET1]
MTTNAPRLSDEELMAYLDGMLEADRRAAVERQLAEDPQACARLEEWRHQNEMIGALYAPV